MPTSFLYSTLSLLTLILTFTNTSSKKTLNSTTDEQTLLSFKNTTISSGIFALKWTTTTSFCNWPHVTCGARHRRVRALNLSGLALGGPLAPHLGNLTFLQSLDVSNNSFTGVLPTELAKLRRLKLLNVGFNNFSGEIPPWLGALPELRYLRLRNNSFSGEVPSSLFNVSSLVEINMRFNEISGELPHDICSNSPNLESLFLSVNRIQGNIPANIGKCGGLQDLRLVDNYFNGKIPSEIGNLSMLGFLSLGGNNFQGEIPREIGKLWQLESLYLQSASLTGNIPDSIFNFSFLTIMDLSNNSLIGTIPTVSFYNLPQIQDLKLLSNHLTGAVPKQFGNSTYLKTLDLAYNRLSGELPKELGNLVSLESFVAPFNDFLSGQIPPSIFNISTLKLLSLQQNNFSGSLPPNMGLSLSNLEELYLYFNKLEGKIPSSINNASKLTMLELNRNSFTGSPPNFGNLRDLRALRLWDNHLAGAESPDQEITFLSSLTNCRNLKYLEISNNSKMSGILPDSIANLSTSLVTFEASNCNIGGVIPSGIVNLSSLEALILYENQLRGEVPLDIGKLKRLRRLYLGTNHLEGFIPVDLCQMSKLGELNLSDNVFVGPIPGCLGRITSLRQLYLDSNRLNFSVPSELWNLTDLVSLNLSTNYLSGQLSSQVGRLKTINDLDLSGNRFSGEILSSIAGCTSLETLSLSNNTFGGSIPQSFENMRSLSVLDISRNNLSGLIPKNLAKLDLEYLDVSHNNLEGEIPDGGCFANFTAQAFAQNSALCGSARFGVQLCGKKSHGKTRFVDLMKYVLPPVVATMVLVILVVVVIRRRRVIKPLFAGDTSVGISWRRVSYIELVRATNAFSETSLLGRGSFGSVFKGKLSDDLDVAVKVFDMQSERAVKSFETESEILSGIRHRNLLRVIGCCSNEEFKGLILEYMPNGSLEKWLHSGDCWMDMLQRVDVAIDVALGLEYLHHSYTFPVVHCDVKPSNVLLDEDMTARLADFGVSKLFHQGETMVLTKTLATVGYAAPEYGSEGKVSIKGDVYSYGILLLEMLTGKKPTDDMFSGEMSLKEWISEALEEDATTEVAEQGLLAREDHHFIAKERCLSSIFHLAMKCLMVSPNERIDMVEAAATLKKIRATLLAAIRRRQ